MVPLFAYRSIPLLMRVKWHNLSYEGSNTYPTNRLTKPWLKKTT